MQIILTIIIFTFLSVVALGEGTLSTDNNPASRAEASLSGYEAGKVEVEEDDIEAQEARGDDNFYLDEEETENKNIKETDQGKDKTN